MWHATALIVMGAALGVTGYILWSSRATHSDHSHYDAATSVRAVQSRVLGDRWAKRYGYSPLGRMAQPSAMMTLPQLVNAPRSEQLRTRSPRKSPPGRSGSR